MPDEPAFPGFDSPHYTQVPNTLFDVLLAAGTLTEAELRVLLYICRRTFGFGKDADAISLGQLTEGITTRDGRRLDYGAGVSRPAASRAVKGLERKGVITVCRARDARGGDAINTYALRWRVSQGLPNLTPLVAEVNPPGNTAQPEGVTDGNPQNESNQNKAPQEGSWRPVNAPTAAEVQARGLGRSVPPGGR